MSRYISSTNSTELTGDIIATGPLTLEQYAEFNDITAPANGSDGQGRLYKKTGDDGIFWKPDSAGLEVDLTGGGGGSGDVVGPVSAVDNTITRFNGTTGKLIQGSGLICSDLAELSGLPKLTFNTVTDVKTTVLNKVNINNKFSLTDDIIVPGGGSAYSMTLNGTQSVGFGNNTAFEYNSSFSTGCWFKTSTSGTMPLISKREGTVNRRGWSLRFVSSSDRFVISITNVDNVTEIQQPYLHTTGTYNNGAWHHIIMTYNGNGLASGLVLYVDNVVQTPAAPDYNTLGTNTIINTSQLRIGREGLGTNYFTGDVDEMRVYSKVLTVGEVAANWNGGAGRYGTPEANLVLGVHFDEGVGTTCADYSGSGFTGTSTSSVWGVGKVSIGGSQQTINVLSSQDGLAVGEYGIVKLGDSSGTTQIDATKLSVNGLYTLPVTDGTIGQALVTDGAGAVTFGDVVSGPALAINNNISVFDGVTGKLIKDSLINANYNNQSIMIGATASNLSTLNANSLIIGTQSDHSLLTGINAYNNCLIGYNSGAVLTNSYGNVALGTFSLASAGLIDGAVAIGDASQYSNLTSNYNCSMGSQALNGLIDGGVGFENAGHNTCLGTDNAFQLLHGRNNTSVGSSTDLGVTTDIALNRAAYGFEAYNRTDNTVVIGNSSVENIRPANTSNCDLGTATDGFRTLNLLGYATASLPAAASYSRAIAFDSDAGRHKYSNGATWELLGGSGSGDVVGPSSAVDNGLVTFDGVTGKLVQDSGATLSTFGSSTIIGPVAQTEFVPIVASSCELGTVSNPWQGLGLKHIATGSLPAAASYEGTIKYDSTLNRPVCSDGTAWIDLGSSGSGDVVGPSSAVDSNLCVFDTTTGKLIKDSLINSSVYTGGITPSVWLGTKPIGVPTITSNSNLFVGAGCGEDLTDGIGNNGYGSGALGNLTSGDFNVAFSDSALGILTTGNQNTAVGYQALRVCNADFNVGMGYRCGTNISIGSANTLMGTICGENISSGSLNCLSGYGVAPALTLGSYNVGMGPNCLTNLVDGTHNVATGRQSGDNLTSGSFNICHGVNSLQAATTASNCIGIGQNTTVAATLDNQIAIGYGSTTTAANTCVIGNSTLTSISSGGTSCLLGTAGQAFTGLTMKDVAAPSNPGAGVGSLYKLTGNDGLWWKPDSAGVAVDLTSGAPFRNNLYMTTVGQSATINDATVGGAPIVYNISPSFADNASVWTIAGTTSPTMTYTGANKRFAIKLAGSLYRTLAGNVSIGYTLNGGTLVSNDFSSPNAGVASPVSYNFVIDLTSGDVVVIEAELSGVIVGSFTKLSMSIEEYGYD